MTVRLLRMIRALVFMTLGLLIIITDSMKIKFYAGLFLFAIGTGMFSMIRKY